MEPKTLLTILTDEDIAQHWDVFAPGIERGLPGFIALQTHEVMNNILEALLAGALQMWLVRTEGEQVETIGVLVTGVLDNPITGLRSMWIYGISPLRYDRAIWSEAIDLLKRVAKRQRCWQIQTFVRRKRMREVLRDMGADVETRAITWRIE